MAVSAPAGEKERRPSLAELWRLPVSEPVGTDDARVALYRMGYHRLMAMAQVMAAIVCGLIVVFIILLVARYPQDAYYAESSTGARMRLLALERPYISHEVLFDWATNSAAQIMTFGFNDYDAKLTAARERFTDKGWLSFAQTMSGSLFFRNVVAQQQIATAVPRAPAALFSESLSSGRYTWVVEVPLMVTVRAGGRSRSISQTVRLVIVRVPTEVNPMGIAIDRWISF